MRPLWNLFLDEEHDIHNPTEVHNREALEAIAKHESLDRAVCGAEGIATCLNISSTLFHGSTQKATNREALGEIAKHELHEVQRVLSKTLQLDPKYTIIPRKYTYSPRK